jgi:hypothetical protein
MARSKPFLIQLKIPSEKLTPNHRIRRQAKAGSPQINVAWSRCHRALAGTITRASLSFIERERW